MEKDIAGSETAKNLVTAYGGESMAAVKYGFYASAAAKEGFEQIGAVFAETAANEREHAKIWFKYLHGGEVPASLSNLKDAASGEHFEWAQMYADFAAIAKKEGFAEIAARFEMVAGIEKTHEERYLALIKNMENGKVFSRDDSRIWICRNCGYIHIGSEAPVICPVCSHPRAYFELRAENY